MAAGLPTEKSTASFWHSEPSEFLLGHRTTPELPTEADVVIVGSGITGASAARFLSEDERARGLKVVMLEAREACWGATGRNGGHCQPLLYMSSPDIAAFEIRNWETVRSYIENNNVPCEWRSTNGCMSFWNEQLAEWAMQEVQSLKAHAPELADRVSIVTDQDQLRRNHRVNGAPLATITLNTASLWPYKLITFVLQRAIEAGRLNLQTHTPVTKLEAGSPSQASARYRLSTPRGSIATQHVILATNAYTSHLLPEFHDLIVPERGVMSALLPPKGATRLPNTYGFVGANGADPHRDDYLNQRPYEGVPNPAGHLMFGGGTAAATLEHTGVTDDSVLDEGSATYLRRELLDLLAMDGETDGLDELKATHQWSGILTTTKDKRPWVGSVPGRKGVWLSGGYNGHGMPNGTLCGKAVVEMLLGEVSGAPADYVEERLVRTGALPESYLISEERIERCKKLEPVKVQVTEEFERYQQWVNKEKGGDPAMARGVLSGNS